MFEVNPDFKVTKVQLQDDDNFILILDDFLLRPEDVVEFSKHRAYFDPVGADGTFYPGVRDLMPAPYARALLAAVQPIVADEYFSGQELNSMDPVCKLSLITLKPEQLADEQRVPHVDSVSENEFAIVHYLCDESHGGTSLYRYKPTGQVKITSNFIPMMREMVGEAKARPEEHCGYLSGDTSIFQRIGQVKAKFNRMVLYKSNLLHCADIESLLSCQKNPETGRLSVASFMYFEKK